SNGVRLLHDVHQGRLNSSERPRVGLLGRQFLLEPLDGYLRARLVLEAACFPNASCPVSGSVRDSNLDRSVSCAVINPGSRCSLDHRFASTKTRPADDLRRSFLFHTSTTR